MKIIDGVEYHEVPHIECASHRVKCSLWDNCVGADGRPCGIFAPSVILYTQEDYLKYLAAKLTK